MSITRNPRKAAALLLVTLGTWIPAAPWGAAEPSEGGIQAARVLALAPLQGKATLHLSGAGILLVAEGEEVAETGTVVVEVLADRVVLEDRTEAETSWIWLYKPQRPGEPSRLRRFTRRPPERLEVRPAPVWIPVQDPATDVPEDDVPSGSATEKNEEEGDGDGR